LLDCQRPTPATFKQSASAICNIKAVSAKNYVLYLLHVCVALPNNGLIAYQFLTTLFTVSGDCSGCSQYEANQGTCLSHFFFLISAVSFLKEKSKKAATFL